MIKYSFLLFLIPLFFFCGNPSDDGSFTTSSIEEDYSSIENPRERWQAYRLSDYYIEQSWSCECFPPGGCESFIIDNSIADVKYTLPGEAYFGRSEEDIYNYTKDMAITIDEAFALIEKYENSADKIEVEYDPRFGFPTKLFIDIDAQMADEEIIRSFGTLKKIVP